MHHITDRCSVQRNDNTVGQSMTAQCSFKIKHRAGANRLADGVAGSVKHYSPRAYQAGQFLSPGQIAVGHKPPQITPLKIRCRGGNIQTVADNTVVFVNDITVGAEAPHQLFIINNFTVICDKTKIKPIIIKGISGFYDFSDNLIFIIINVSVSFNMSDVLRIEIRNRSARIDAADKLSV